MHQMNGEFVHVLLLDADSLTRESAAVLQTRLVRRAGQDEENIQSRDDRGPHPRPSYLVALSLTTVEREGRQGELENFRGEPGNNQTTSSHDKWSSLRFIAHKHIGEIIGTRVMWGVKNEC